MAKWTEKEKNEGEMIMTIDGRKWANAKLAAMDVLKHAGKEMSDDNITEAALNTQLDHMFAEGIEELGLKPATLPDIEVRNVTSDSATVAFIFALSPEVTIGDYSGIKYEEESSQVTDADVEEAVKTYMEEKAKEGKPDKNDTAKKNTAGSSLNDLAAAKPASSSGIILSGDVRKSAPVMQESKGTVLDDDYVKSQKIKGVNTVAEFKAYMKKVLEQSRKLFNAQAAEQAMMDQLLSVCEVEIPGRLIMGEVSSMLQTLAATLNQQGISIKEYLEEKGQSDEDLINELMPEAEKKVKTSLALEAVAKEKNLYPSNSEIDGEYKAMAIRFGVDVQQVRQALPVSEVSYSLMLKKTMEYLKGLNK